MGHLPYTKYPRPCLWLVRGDWIDIGGGCSEQPAFKADIGSFYISRSCISNEAFQAFRPDFVPSATSPGKDDPAVGVSFQDAVAYCDWWSEVSHKSFRLPTEQEWELACGGGEPGRYPWGDAVDGSEGMAYTAENSLDCCPALEGLMPNGQGIFGMIGGVWEWTASRWGGFPIPDEDDRVSREPSGDRVVRGGSFRNRLDELGTRVRSSFPEDYLADDLGFRIVRSL